MSEQPHGAEEALQRALAAHGIAMGDFAARIATEAVLSYRDEDAAYSMSAPRQHWEDPAFQSYARQRVWRDLLENIVELGKVPVSLPRESLRYLVSWSFQEVPESADWDTVEFTLSVGVRVPPVDRRASLSAPGTGAPAA